MSLKTISDAEVPATQPRARGPLPANAAAQLATLEKSTLLGVDLLRGHQIDLLAPTPIRRIRQVKIKDVQIDGFGVWSGPSAFDAGQHDCLLRSQRGRKTTLMQFLRAMFYGFTPERRTATCRLSMAASRGVLRVTGPGGAMRFAVARNWTSTVPPGALTVTGSDGLSQDCTGWRCC